MMRPSAIRWHIPALAAVVVAGALVVAPAAPADSSLVGLSVSYQGREAIYVDVCLTTAENLPAQVVLDFEIASGSTVVASDSWDGGNPGTIFVDAPTCPASFAQFVATNLSAGTAYRVSVTASVTPMIEDEDFELAPDPVGYPAFSSTTDLAISTLPSEPSRSSGSDGGAGGGPDSGDRDGIATTGGTAAGTSSPGSGGTGLSPAPPLVIRAPESFTPAQLVALSPQQVATIAPASFGQLPPAAFAALTSGQAAAITPGQASAIRPARAAELTPRAVTALSVDALSALRPAAITWLSPAAVGAMTSAQLKALTPRQVSALRPKQLAELTPAERALLRR